MANYKVTNFAGKLCCLGAEKIIVCYVFTVFLYPNGLWKRLREIRTWHTLINGEGGITNMFHLAAIQYQSLRVVHLYSVILTSCGPSETTSNTFLVTPLWYVFVILLYKFNLFWVKCFWVIFFYCSLRSF